LRAVRGFETVKSFLKVVLLILAAVIAVKFLPLIFGLGCLLAGLLLGGIAFGISAVAAFVACVIALLAVLAPIWLPILALVGLIILIKRGGTRKNGGVAA
jgi:hypothetical protein